MRKLSLSVAFAFLLGAVDASAANYFCVNPRVQSAIAGTSYQLTMTCTYLGTDVLSGTFDLEIAAVILYNRNAAQIQGDFVDQVVLEANRNLVPNTSAGFGVTVARTDGTLVSFAKGN